MDQLNNILGSLVVVAAVVIAFFVWLKKQKEDFIVYEYQIALLYRFGKKERLLEPGKHRMWGKGWEVMTVDTRTVNQAIPNQEILTSDGVTVKVSVTAQYAVVDIEKALLESVQYLGSAYLVAQAAVRDVVANGTVEELLASRNSLDEQLLAQSIAGFAALGLRLDEVRIRDITLAGDLKRTFAQVPLARLEGLAALERARGEAAALRHLANAAKILENNPDLMKLRILQALGQAKGATVILNTTESTITPLAS